LEKQKLDSCWSLPLIYSGAGMTREQDNEIICRGGPMCPPENDNWQMAIDNKNFLYPSGRG